MSRKVQDIKRPEIVKLARTPYTNYEAFLASVEDWLMPDEGVFEFFVSGRVLETPLEAVRKLMSDRESSSSSSSSTGVTTRSMTMDPLLSMYYQSEINKIQKKYEDWIQACTNFLMHLKSPQVVDREIMESVQTHAQWREWSEARPPNLHSIAVQLLSAASGAVRRDPFLARQEFEKILVPKPKESLRHLLVRIDGDLNSLSLTLQILSLTKNASTECG
jgi:hypothetical protein